MDAPTMNEDNPLECTLHNILRLINPLEEDRSHRFQVIQGLRAIVQNIHSLKDAIVEPYGSFVSDLFTKWGDIDVCIELGNACATTKKEKLTLLIDVLKELKSRGGYNRLKLISSARVPILMFRGNHNISCDISINNIDGKIKSKLLYWISSIDGRFRDMVLLVKEWAKAHNINNSKCATLNSYSLCLLIIFHFQTCVPPILPPLKEIYPGNVMDDIKEARIEQKNIQEICSSNINRFVQNVSRAHNQSSLSVLFTSFIAGLRDLGSRAAKQGINTYAGQWEDIEGNTRWLPNKYPLIIEDPFEQPMNAARVVSKKQLLRIAQTFNRTYDVLVSPNQNPDLLMCTLVGPQVLRPRATTNNTRANQPKRTKQPRPAKVKQPEPTKVKQPEPTKTKQPQPTKIEQPQPTNIEQPQPTKTKQPQPTKDKQPQPTKIEQPQPSKAKQPRRKRNKRPHPQPKVSEAFGASSQVREQRVTQPGQEAFGSIQVRAQSVVQSGQAFGAPQVRAQSVMQPGQVFGAFSQVRAQSVAQSGQAFGAPQVRAQHAVQPGQVFGARQVWAQPEHAFGALPQVWSQPGHAFGALPQVWAQPGQAFGAPQVRAHPVMHPGQAFGAQQVRAHPVMQPRQVFGAQQVRAHPVMQPGQAFGGHPHAWAHHAMQSRQAFGAPPQGWLQPVMYPSDGKPQSILRSRPAKTPRLQWD